MEGSKSVFKHNIGLRRSCRRRRKTAKALDAESVRTSKLEPQATGEDNNSQESSSNSEDSNRSNSAGGSKDCSPYLIVSVSECDSRLPVSSVIEEHCYQTPWMESTQGRNSPYYLKEMHLE